MQRWKNFFEKTAASTMTEYALLIAFIALAVVIIVENLGVSVSNTFGKAAQGLG